MSNINNLNVIADESLVTWKFKGKMFSLPVSDIDQVMIDESRELIFVLDQKKELPHRLSIISGCGEVVSTFPPPNGGQFYYMTIDAKKEVLVVCVFTEKIDGWSDWHFSFNQNDNLLLRVSPAY
ncbi:hypothetical protein WKG85_12520 [Pantoea agglomerans]|uniref:hypothetical protein n=1 Tax=Enterobacter agglomerans TaxID=549 RepID=UPI003C7EB00F